MDGLEEPATRLDETLPLVLAAIHRSCTPGTDRRLRFEVTGEALGAEQLAADVLTGAGFAVERIDRIGPDRRHRALDVSTTRLWSLPDTVGPGMRLLVCGLNPSPAAADAGIGFARPGNRFWPAALAAGLVTADRDPDAALARHGVGMTDLVKRTTTRADELDPDEYRAGLGRVERLVAWLAPAAVLFVGLAGWRVAVDRRARPGLQPGELGGAAVYVMPSTSGLNASSSQDDLTDHLRTVGALPGVAG